MIIRENEKLREFWREVPQYHNDYKFGRLTTEDRDNLCKYVDLSLELEEEQEGVVYELPLIQYIHGVYKYDMDRVEFAERLIRELRDGEIEFMVQQNWFSAYKDKRDDCGYWRPFGGLMLHRYVLLEELTVRDIVAIIGGESC